MTYNAAVRDAAMDAQLNRHLRERDAEEREWAAFEEWRDALPSEQTCDYLFEFLFAQDELFARMNDWLKDKWDALESARIANDGPDYYPENLT